MSSSVSYHLPQSIQDYISRKSQENSLSRGKFLISLIQRFSKLSQENNDLKSYLVASADQKFLEQEMQEADNDLAVEQKYNATIWSK